MPESTSNHLEAACVFAIADLTRITHAVQEGEPLDEGTRWRDARRSSVRGPLPALGGDDA